jgi:HEAT repeat protein
MHKSREEPVRAAAIRALGPLGQPAEVPLFLQRLAAGPEAEKTAARGSLARLRGRAVNEAIAAEVTRAGSPIRIELISILTTRRATDSIPALLAAAEDADSTARMAAMAALGQLAGPEHVADMVKGLLKAEKGPEREAAEKAVMFVCNRIEDPAKRAEPLLAVFAKFDEDGKTALLPALGRVGGQATLKIVEAAIADSNLPRRDAGYRALCNWPDASVAARLLDLSQTADDANHRAWALRALIRGAPLPDKRPLDLLKKAMALTTLDEDRNTVLKRARAIRSIESLRFVVAYLDQPAFAQQACETVVELAHHRGLREPNKAEFDPALDAVIRISKDPNVVDRAKRYKKGQT